MHIKISSINIAHIFLVPNRVMSGYVDLCILAIIKQCTFKTALPILIGEVGETDSIVTVD